MNLFALISDRVRTAINEVAGEKFGAVTLDLGRVVVEPPRDASHGDMATNAALVLAKDAGVKPRELAEALAARLETDPEIAKVEIAGPGFINLTLAPELWTRVLVAALEDPAAFGRSSVGASKRINVEYVSANPTGPMHVGHCRGAVFGDALSSLLDFAGFAVTREYYINDAGAQVDVLARSAFLRYREALGEDIGAIPEGLYPGDYLKPVGKALADLYGTDLRDKPEVEWLPMVKAVAIESMMAMIRDDLAALNIRHDVFFSERSLTLHNNDKVGGTLAELRGRGLVYEGRLPPPKGQLPDDWEDREQTLFRTTSYGDDVDRPLMKSDGSYTYFASDVAYLRDKVERGFLDLIFVLGADHGGYVKRLEAAAQALTDGRGHVDVKLVQLVRLFRAGEPVRMSKRAGDFVTLRDVVDEVGSDAVRFMMLFRKNDAVLDFDFAKVVEKSRDNPVFYVQYAHARACSVLRNAREALGDRFPTEVVPSPEVLSHLTDAGEVELIKRIGEYPRLIEAAADAHEPHRLAFYLHDLASAFHAHWNRGKDAEDLRFIIGENLPLTSARLALVRGIAGVLASGLSLLGVSAPQEMR